MPTMSSSRVNPVETPCTAFAASARVSPCSAACASDSRWISRIPAFCLTLMPSGSGTSRVPFGPCTFNWSPICIFTVEGTGIGFFPTLDMSSSNLFQLLPGSLPDAAKNLAANAFFARCPARHHTPRRSQDADTKPTLNARYIRLADIRSATGARHALDAGHYRRIVGRVLQVDLDDLLDAFF